MTHDTKRRQGVQAESLPPFPLDLLDSLLSMRFDLDLILRNVQAQHPQGLPEQAKRRLRAGFVEARSEEILGSIFPAFFQNDVDQLRAVGCIADEATYVLISFLCDPDPRVRRAGVVASRGLVGRMFSIIGLLLALQKDQSLEVSRESKFVMRNAPAAEKALSAVLRANASVWEEFFGEIEAENAFIQHFIDEVEL